MFIVLNYIDYGSYFALFRRKQGTKNRLVGFAVGTFLPYA